VNGIEIQDMETGETLRQAAKVVVNATGPFSDELRRVADPSVQPIIAPSQGIHLVFDGTFLGSDHAILVPHTSDGRVMFALPWHGHTLVGTTDTPVAQAALEPVAIEREIDFLLQTATRYLARSADRSDVLSVFAGIRPLVRSADAGTASLSRDHTIRIENSGMLTLCGGKWTTYRHMAEDCVNQAATLAQLPERPCVTGGLRIHGYLSADENADSLAHYGADAAAVRQLVLENPDLGKPLHPDLPYCGAEVVWSARHEMARTVEDVLARRTRALFLRARAAIEMASPVADLLARELGRDGHWKNSQIRAFHETARNYVLG